MASEQIITFSSLWVNGKKWHPSPGDVHALLWIKHRASNVIAFNRAYSGWRISGAIEEREFGEGRAFLRWMYKRKISIEWSEKDFCINPLFSGPQAPKHSPVDELARTHSFAISPVKVGQKRVKLYVQDRDMLNLINLSYGQDEDFLELVKNYVSKRFEWEKWRAPAPGFMDWVKNEGRRPNFSNGQLGFHPLF
jgi:hypothetical protein